MVPSTASLRTLPSASAPARRAGASSAPRIPGANKAPAALLKAAALPRARRAVVARERCGLAVCYTVSCVLGVA